MDISYVLQSRCYGHCYVKVADRHDTEILVNNRAVRLYCTGYDRSLVSGGHKYTAYADYVDTGKPVSIKDLKGID